MGETIETMKVVCPGRVSERIEEQVVVLQSTVAVAKRAMDQLRRTSRMISNSASNLKLNSVALNGKSVDLSKGHLGDQ